MTFVQKRDGERDNTVSNDQVILQKSQTLTASGQKQALRAYNK